MISCISISLQQLCLFRAARNQWILPESISRGSSSHTRCCRPRQRCMLPQLRSPRRHHISGPSVQRLSGLPMWRHSPVAAPTGACLKRCLNHLHHQKGVELNFLDFSQILLPWTLTTGHNKQLWVKIDQHVFLAVHSPLRPLVLWICGTSWRHLQHGIRLCEDTTERLG